MAIDYHLTGKRILVTGASSGLGRSIAVEASRLGARLLLLARNETRLRETAALCQNDPGQNSPGQIDPIVFPVDLTADPDGIPRLIRKLTQQYGPLSGVVHAAGICPSVPLRALKTAHFIDSYLLNVVVGALLLKGLSSHGCYSESGASAVLMSSVTGHVGQPGIAAYSASKGGVELLAKSLSFELAPLRIRVNTIAPSIIQTPMADQAHVVLTEEARENLLRSLPGGLGVPEDVAAAAIFLLSDASRFITGSSIMVDGGYCAG